MREDIEKVQGKVEEVSFAMEMLQYSKSQNEQLTDNFKKMYRVWMVTFIGLVIAIGYIVFLLNDIGSYNENTIDIEDVEHTDNSHIKIGDDIWEKSE